MSVDAKFSLFSINVPDYLIVRARKTSAPGAEVARSAPLGPAPVGNLNFIVPGLDPVNHFFDLYESTDGETLNTLLGTWTWDVQNSETLEEIRYYIVGSGVNNSPNDGDTSFVDAYLDGKNVVKFEKRSIGPLIPGSEGYTAEWTFDPMTNTVALSGLAFANMETYAVTILYSQPVPTSGSNAFFQDVKTITADTLTMDSTYRNNRVRCIGTGTQQVVAFEPITGIPDGTFWYFTHHDGGTQFQTKFVFSDANLIFAGGPYPEFWIGRGEELWIEKRGSQYEVIQAPAGALLVGHHSSQSVPSLAGNFPYPNLYPEDNSLWGADDLPRLWWWLTHIFPNGNYFISDDNLDNPGYVRPTSAGQPWKAGMFIISTTKRKFRMPDTQGFSEQGSKSFSTFGTDAQRLFDYPGGFMPQAVVDHVHNMHDINPISDGGVNRFISKTANTYNYEKAGTNPILLGGNATGAPDITLITGHPRTIASATSIGQANQAVNNFSVIYYRHA